MNFSYSMVHPVLTLERTRWCAWCRDGIRKYERIFDSPEEANAFCRGWEDESEARRSN